MVHGSLGAVKVLGKLIRCYNDGTSRGRCGDDAENFFLSGFKFTNIRASQDSRGRERLFL